MACVDLLLFEAVDERYNVLLFQAPEHFDFSHDCLFRNFVFFDPTQLPHLNGLHFPSQLMPGTARSVQSASPVRT